MNESAPDYEERRRLVEAITPKDVVIFEGQKCHYATTDNRDRPETVYLASGVAPFSRAVPFDQIIQPIRESLLRTASKKAESAFGTYGGTLNLAQYLSVMSLSPSEVANEVATKLLDPDNQGIHFMDIVIAASLIQTCVDEPAIRNLEWLRREIRFFREQYEKYGQFTFANASTAVPPEKLRALLLPLETSNNDPSPEDVQKSTDEFISEFVEQNMALSPSAKELLTQTARTNVGRWSVPDNVTGITQEGRVITVHSRQATANYYLPLTPEQEAANRETFIQNFVVNNPALDEHAKTLVIETVGSQKGQWNEAGKIKAVTQVGRKITIADQKGEMYLYLPH